jgi:hypothetical protein
MSGATDVEREILTFVLLFENGSLYIITVTDYPEHTDCAANSYTSFSHVSYLLELSVANSFPSGLSLISETTTATPTKQTPVRLLIPNTQSVIRRVRIILDNRDAVQWRTVHGTR